MPQILKYVVTLKRRHFKDRPDWQVINDDVPLGTEYRILGIRANGIFIRRTDTNEEREVMCYFATRDGDDKPGYLPVDVFND